MIVLYGSQGSGAAIAEIALDITGVPYRSVQAASWKPEERAGLDELRRVNPLAQIPTLALDDGTAARTNAGLRAATASDAASSRVRVVWWGRKRFVGGNMPGGSANRIRQAGK